MAEVVQNRCGKIGIGAIADSASRGPTPSDALPVVYIVGLTDADAMDAQGFQAHNRAHNRTVDAMLEVNRAKIARRLSKEGWTNEGGKKHDAYTHPDFDFPAIVPRHKELSPGVARDIARVAGW